jgi:hypothetical protein
VPSVSLQSIKCLRTDQSGTSTHHAHPQPSPILSSKDWPKLWFSIDVLALEGLLNIVYPKLIIIHMRKLNQNIFWMLLWTRVFGKAPVLEPSSWTLYVHVGSAKLVGLLRMSTIPLHDSSEPWWASLHLLCGFHLYKESLNQCQKLHDLLPTPRGFLHVTVGVIEEEKNWWAGIEIAKAIRDI